MNVAEFEEKQYESGLLWELAGSSPHFFSSGQALEAAVGYDFAISPGDPSVFSLLGTGLPPGVLLTPSFWPAQKRPTPQRLPTHLVSLIVQAKRPEWLDHWRAAQYDYFRGPYFRFHLNDRQQRILEVLERAVRGKALVRYASPAFLSYKTLENLQLARAIAEHSSFVAPSELVGHSVWSYSGPGIVGFANPDGEERRSDSRDSLVDTARRLASSQSFSAHFRDLSEAMDAALSDAEEAVTPARREWAGIFAERVGWPRNAAQVWADWTRIADGLALTGAAWLVLGFDDE